MHLSFFLTIGTGKTSLSKALAQKVSIHMNDKYENIRYSEKIDQFKKNIQISISDFGTLICLKPTVTACFRSGSLK